MRWAIKSDAESGDGVSIERSQAMNTFFKGLAGVGLSTVAGAGLGAASFFAAEALLPKQAAAAAVHNVAKTPKNEPKLSARQTILEANRHLIANGWRPAPERTPTPEERRLSSVALESLSTCSGTGVGFCRFDYRRDLQRLSVVSAWRSVMTHLLWLLPTL